MRLRSPLRHRRVSLAVVVAAALACSRPKEGPPVQAAAASHDAGSPEAAPANAAPAEAPPATAGAADAGPVEVVTAPLPVRIAVATVAERDVPLTAEAPALVEPGAAFRVEVAVPLTDGRLSLRDEQDSMVPSTGTTELGASWTRYRLTPEAPLRPGTTYLLLLDGSLTQSPHDATGRAFRPVFLTVKIAGERAATRPKTRARARSR